MAELRKRVNSTAVAKKSAGKRIQVMTQGTVRLTRPAFNKASRQHTSNAPLPALLVQRERVGRERRRPGSLKNTLQDRYRRKASGLLGGPLEHFGVCKAELLGHNVRAAQAQLNCIVTWVPCHGFFSPAVGPRIPENSKLGLRSAALGGRPAMAPHPDDVGARHRVLTELLDLLPKVAMRGPRRERVPAFVPSIDDNLAVEI